MIVYLNLVKTLISKHKDFQENISHMKTLRMRMGPAIGYQFARGIQSLTFGIVAFQMTMDHHAWKDKFSEVHGQPVYARWDAAEQPVT